MRSKIMQTRPSRKSHNLQRIHSQYVGKLLLETFYVYYVDYVTYFYFGDNKKIKLRKEGVTKAVYRAAGWVS